MSDKKNIIVLLTRDARNQNVMHGPSVAASWENDGARAAHRWWFG